MASNELVILDVGHGNCTIIRRENTAIVVDAPSKPVVAKALDELKISNISALVISHADEDHLSGAVSLLMDSNRPVQNVYVNPDPRKTLLWTEFRKAVAVARKVGTKINAALDTNVSGQVKLADTTLHVLHPTPEYCLSAIGGKDLEGKKVDANSMSAVVRVDHAGKTICLLAADATKQSLNWMLKEGLDMKAAVLVFPHHGGHADAKDNRIFAKDFVSSVQPALVIFSLGRGVHHTPRPEIVAGVREALANKPYIACTQLSTRCATAMPAGVARTVDARSDGASKDACCAGSVSVNLDTSSVAELIKGLAAGHGQFVAAHVPGALCMKH